MQDRHVHFNMKALSKNQRRKYCRFPEYRKCFNERIRVLQEFKAQGEMPTGPTNETATVTYDIQLAVSDEEVKAPSDLDSYVEA